MANHAEERRSSGTVPDTLRRALAALLEAFHFAADTGSDLWDFAVSIRNLRKLGLSETHLRWLVRKGYVQHAREVTVPGEDGRAYRSTGDLTFTRKTCFVLTDNGVAAASCSSTSSSAVQQTIQTVEHPSGNGQCPDIRWDQDSRKLSLNGRLVKRFKWPAMNQEAILCAFQEEGWPERIDDPLPPQPEQDPKRRLSDTIKCLNRKQINPLMRFHGDGTGEGVLWELVAPDANGNGRHA